MNHWRVSHDRARTGCATSHTEGVLPDLSDGWRQCRRPRARTMGRPHVDVDLTRIPLQALFGCPLFTQAIGNISTRESTPKEEAT